MKFAFATAAVDGDNAGDAIIEDAIRRLVAADTYLRFPLTRPLLETDIDAINSCDALILCGTNLYQAVFACNLTEAVIEQIKIPIIPFGIGSSAPIGTIPKMNREGVQAVRALHKRCRVSSVRDTASLKFLHSIGVHNTVLTGCPVLFHGIQCPDFRTPGDGYTLTPRARLLHTDNKWGTRQMDALDFLCKRFHPTLVLQSPYDLTVAQELSTKYQLEVVFDDKWQADLYAQYADRQNATFGFRLHFGMLSLSHGRPAYFVAHDSRVSEFCELVGLPFHDITQFSNDLLALQISTRSFNADIFRIRWNELAVEMNKFMSLNELNSRLEAFPIRRSFNLPPNRSLLGKRKTKPRILMLLDTRNWAFDHSARAISKLLSREFDFQLRYVHERPNLYPDRYDLLYLFFWGEKYYRKLKFNSDAILKELSSHRWEDNPLYGPLTPVELVDRYFSDAGTVICTSERLRNKLLGLHPRVNLTPNGYDPDLFRDYGRRKGSLVIGWAGNASDPLKGLHDILEPAVGNQFQLKIAPGKIPHSRMSQFYNDIDVFAVTSKHEGEPLTLIEAMASGCFPVIPDIGIAPELIESGRSGIIVTERSPEAFNRAFQWCASNLSEVRAAGAENARRMWRERRWEVVVPFFRRVFWDALQFAERPKFRNDDVSWDTPLERFQEFCQIFWKYKLQQLHGLTLRGRTSTLFEFDSQPVEYASVPNISLLENARIRELSEGLDIEQRPDLIEFLANSPDDIALHGLYHTDYSTMTADDQYQDITSGLKILKNLFPRKIVKYFIPPFNRTNQSTHDICKDLGLTLLDATGTHLEAVLGDLKVKPATWYRYHHHRFYPESKFNYYKLSLDLLDASLVQNFVNQPHDFVSDSSR